MLFRSIFKSNFFSISISTSIKFIFSFLDTNEPIEDFPEPIMPKKTKFSFEFINFCIEKTQICLNLILTKEMQFTRNTSSRKNIINLIFKLVLVLALFLGTIFLLSKIDFPAPKKEIEKIISNENFKIVK